MMERCAWAVTPLSIAYHDVEWGTPQHDDRALFELLILEGAQAGLSWETILRKRENFRAAFDGFDAEAIARYEEKKKAQLLANPGIIRNRLKIAAAIKNARAFVAVQEEFGTFDRYIWGFVNDRAIKNPWTSPGVPTHSLESDAMSRDLKKRGFSFVGTTICYAFMQAVGLVNDHERRCFRYDQ
ncbi:MAG: DNA-3-methyladenine glycosylase I [Syntrophorhabdales bacterium]|jgi:DNA-3-methyladenine glycosylase I